MSEQEKMNQLALELRLREEQLKRISDNTQLIRLQMDELNSALQTLNSLKGLKTGHPMQVSIGAGIYVKMSVKAIDKLAVDLGSKIIAEKTPDEALKLIQKRIKKAEELRETLDKQLGITARRAQEVQTELQGLVDKVRQERASGV